LPRNNSIVSLPPAVIWSRALVAKLSVNRLLGGMSELEHRTIPENIQIETVLAGGLWRSFCDAHQLENALPGLRAKSLAVSCKMPTWMTRAATAC
jgi:hypothetical protein